MRPQTFSAVRATSLLACVLAGAVSMTNVRSNASKDAADDVEAQSSGLEVLMGFRVVGTTLHFRVATGGCTTAEDFRLDVSQPKQGARHVTLALRRVRIDACKGFFPDGTEITFDMGAVGIAAGQPIVVRNPFGAHGGSERDGTKSSPSR